MDEVYTLVVMGGYILRLVTGKRQVTEVLWKIVDLAVLIEYKVK